MQTHQPDPWTASASELERAMEGIEDERWRRRFREAEPLWRQSEDLPERQRKRRINRPLP